MSLVSQFNMLFFMLKEKLVSSEEDLQNSKAGCHRRTLCTFQQVLRHHKISLIMFLFQRMQALFAFYSMGVKTQP